MNVSKPHVPELRPRLPTQPKPTSNQVFAAILQSTPKPVRSTDLGVPLRADEQEKKHCEASAEPTLQRAPPCASRFEPSEQFSGVAVPDGTQFALSLHGPETDARLVVPEGRVAGVEFFMRAEGKRLRVRTEDADGAAYMRIICARLRHRGYDAEVDETG